MCMRRAVCLLICFAAAGALSARPVQIGDGIPLDLKSIPISEWINGGERAEIPWDFRPLASIDPLGYWNRFEIRSEEHTSELQSRVDLVCRPLLETNTKASLTSSA